MWLQEVNQSIPPPVYLADARLIQVQSEAVKTVKAHLDQAPWGYHGLRNDLSDWRSWEAYFGGIYCMQSIQLQQRLPERIPDAIRYSNRVLEPQRNLPKLPAKTISLAALAPAEGEPAMPPLDFVQRACLLVDCVGSTSPQLIGIKTQHNASLDSVVPQVAAVLGIDCVGGLMEDGTRILFGSITNGVTRTLAEHFRFDSSSSDFMSLSWSKKEAQLIAWRTNDVDQHSLRNVAHSTVVDILLPEVEECSDDISADQVMANSFCVKGIRAGLVPVPLLVPTTFEKLVMQCEKSPRQAYVREILAILERWSICDASKLEDRVPELAESLYRHVPVTRTSEMFGCRVPCCLAREKVGDVLVPYVKGVMGLALVLSEPLEPVKTDTPRTDAIKHEGPHAHADEPMQTTSAKACVRTLADEGIPQACVDARVETAEDQACATAQESTLHACTSPVADELMKLEVEHTCAAEDPVEGTVHACADEEIKPQEPRTRTRDLLDLQKLVKPPRHKSVTLLELRRHAKYVKQRMESHKHWSRMHGLPMKAFNQLVSLQTVYREKDGELRGPALQHVALVTLPDGGHALRVTLHARETMVSGKATVIQDMNRFETFPDSNRTPPARKYKHERKHILSSFLRMLLQSNSKYKGVCKQLERPSMQLGLGNILDQIEAPLDLPEAPQPRGFAKGIKLHKYQLQTLKWMCDAEDTQLRDKLWICVNKKDKVYYSPEMQKLCIGVPAGCRGGFLAEEMGLGKTVISLALHLAHPAPPAVESGSRLKTAAGTRYQSRGTLVLCKVSLVGQWVKEARSKLANRSLSICEYHGSSRTRSVEKLAACDVVVTTYETLASDHHHRSKKQEGAKNPLAKIKWWRIIFDESHAMKDTSTTCYTACCTLQAERRWACSGTPINTDLRDLGGQLGGLLAAPFSEPGFARQFLKGGLSVYQQQVMCLLRRLMIRHSKRAVQEQGECVLPPKTEELLPIKLTDAEWGLYERVHAGVRAEFEGYARSGPAFCQKHTMAIMALLTPLRRLCSGLVYDGAPLPAAATGADDNGRQVAAGQPCHPGRDDVECSICMEPFEQPMRTPCGHWYCHECIGQIVHVQGLCPMCRTPVAADQLQPARYPEVQRAPAKQAQNSFPTTQLESKIKVLIKQLKEMHAADPSNKALIFTQYKESVNTIARKLGKAGFSHRTISGNMPMKQRAAAIKAFQHDGGTTVFIATQRSGAVGVNLTSANYIFLLEPLLNIALDAQAVGRAWRMGQKRPVVVKRLFIKGSVEEAILDVAEMRQMFNSGQETTARKSGDQKVGMHTADRTAVRWDEMSMLFAMPGQPDSEMDES
eukprot:jgi/Ulvmu1/7520/UM037_0064.1